MHTPETRVGAKEGRGPGKTASSPDEAMFRSGAAEPSAIGGIRLNPVELANPAFRDDPAFGRTASGAYGGRDPRCDSSPDEGERTGDAGSGRRARTGGCGFRWVRTRAEGDADPLGFRWRRVAVDDGADDGDAVASDERCQPRACGAFSYLDNGDGAVTLVAYRGSAPRVEVPAEVDGRAVAVIGPALFSNHVELERVSIPEPVRVIDEHAFDGCMSLADVVLPATLEHIGVLAFAKTGLSALYLPPLVKEIAGKSFFHCKRLASIGLPLGLAAIGEGAFAYSGLERVQVPASVESLGFNAFDLTPAQRNVAAGTIQIDGGNAHYRLVGAGLYRDDALVELVGYVGEYDVAPGTRRIGQGACKRHPTLSSVRLPEGLIEVGADAFRGNRRLRVVELPESLERIGERAFVDTSVSSLRISRNVASIGADALLVQGETQVSAKRPLSNIDLDDANPVYYLQNGLLCERGTSPGGGDTCLLYVGPDAVVRVPDQVTNIAVMAFGGAVGVDELYVHGHVHSFCYGWLSMKEPARVVHVEFGDEVDGYARGDFPLPSLSTRFRYMTDLFASSEGKTLFDFDYYDSWVTCSSSISDLAPAAYERMLHPMGMSDHSKSVYEGIFERKGARICRYFAEHSNIEAVQMLADRGWIDASDINAELEIAMRDGRPQAIACLLEAKHRLEPAGAGGFDFSL